MLIKFTKKTNDAIPFRYSREGDACLDMFSNADYFIKPNNHALVTTGICLEIPKGYEGIVRGRSGYALKGILVHIGTIDSNYRGPIGAIIYNLSDDVIIIRKGDKIAQIAIRPTVHVNLIESSELSITERGDQGYGSSGF